MSDSTANQDEQIAAAMQAYVDAMSGDDVEAIISLFTENATIEDPIGSDPITGHAGLREFYQGGMDAVEKMTLEGNPRIRGNWGACAMRAYPKGMDLKFCMETLDVMEFNAEGKITRMTAYWGDRNIVTES